MSQFREKLRRRVEVQTARDHTRMRRWSRNREARILRTVDAPFLLICIRVCALCMAAGTVLCVSGDLAGWLRAGSDEARLRFLRNAALSAVVVWGLFAAIVIPCAVAQLRKGFDHPWFAQHRLTRKGKLRMSPKRKLHICIAVSAIGFVFFLLAFLLTRAFA
ncbi:MAG: hypothetical protein IJ234_08075 [Clostridia bacterium]|nr:hypothetical protein [Clostridia bacterium]